MKINKEKITKYNILFEIQTLNDDDVIYNTQAICVHLPANKSFEMCSNIKFTIFANRVKEIFLPYSVLQTIKIMAVLFLLHCI